ncbi:MAG: response regulator transcription factor [Candidatus Taylorbacteria bacterium]|nr:response regulator transcription factor [Candidatus Taylorbacteria bacterium]
MRLLIIDDDKDLCDFLKMIFIEENYSVDIFNDGESGSYAARTNDYDIVILDYSLPKKNGLQVCGEIRHSKKHVPILLLSIINTIDNKVNLFNEGIDDYIDKPFSVDELRVRIQALLRRPRQISNKILEVEDLFLDSNKHIVRRGNKGIYLTKKEFGLLEYLMLNKGNVCSRGMIMEHVWNINADPFSNTIEAHILNLRKKIGSRGKKELIHNIPGRGYKIISN